MGKRSGHVRKRAVHDAARVVASLGALADLVVRGADAQTRQVGAVASAMAGPWLRERTVLRLDPDFVGALATSDTSAELTAAWLGTLPYDAVLVSFVEPVVLDDGYRQCSYFGFLAVGARTRPVGPAPAGGTGLAPAWTTYGPLADGDGVRFLWLFTTPGSGEPQGQTVTVYLRGDVARAATVADYLAAQETMHTQLGQPWGAELPTLVPLGIQVLMYLSSTEPDVQPLEPGSYARPQQLERVDVTDVGWRVGAALRTHAAAASPAVPRAGQGAGGWHLPPHLRRAHWHRVRVAERDAAGNVVGDRSGAEGLDWHHEMRWYPPTVVNAKDGPPAPVVRPVR